MATLLVCSSMATRPGPDQEGRSSLHADWPVFTTEKPRASRGPAAENRVFFCELRKIGQYSWRPTKRKLVVMGPSSPDNKRREPWLFVKQERTIRGWNRRSGPCR